MHGLTRRRAALKAGVAGVDAPGMVLSRLRRRTADRVAGDEGFSLVEVLAAVVVLAVLALAAFSGLLTAARTGGDSRARTTAAALAAQELEAYSAVPKVTDILVGTFPRAETVGPRRYDITTIAAWQPALPATGNRCAGPGTSNYPYMKVTVDVRWRGARSAVRSETLLTPRAGTGPADKATLRVRVIDRNGEGRPNVTMALTGPNSPSVPPTDPYGCTVVPNLPDGTYQVQLNLPNQVGVDGQQVYVRPVVVSSSSGARLVELLYDGVARVDVRFAPVPNFTTLMPNLTATLANSGLPLNGQRSQAWASGMPNATTTRLSSLFPFARGYQGWLGRCPGSDPGLYGAGRPVVATRNDNVATTLLAAGGQAVVRVERAGSGVSGVSVRAARTDGCAESSTPFTFTTGTDGYARVLLPFGGWTFTTPGRTPSSAANAQYKVVPGVRATTTFVLP